MVLDSSTAPIREPTESLDDALRSLVKELVAESHNDLMLRFQDEIVEYRKAIDRSAASHLAELEQRLEVQRKALRKLVRILAVFFNNISETVNNESNISRSRLAALEGMMSQ